MNFYSFADIKTKGDCTALAESEYGVTISGGRCAATWRDGTNPQSVSISKDEFYDHSTKQGGGVIQLAAMKFGGDIQQAQSYLGELYHLTPKRKTGQPPASSDCRYERLKHDGYTEAARYEYKDATGSVRHVTVRMEHPENTKQFVQGHTNGDGRIHWTLKEVDTVLYRLPEIAASPWVLLCEGEKSADRLAALNLPTTTAPMGAGKWKDDYTAMLEGKNVAIAPDNDEVGIEHANMIARALHKHAASIKIVGPLSDAKKGGIDDWIDELDLDVSEAAAAVMVKIKATADWEAPATDELMPANEYTDAMKAEAKQSNAVPFRNYVPVDIEVEKRGRKVTEVSKEPRTHDAMLSDLSRRFLGFPRRVGDSWLFDHDHDTNEIIHIRDSDDLLSWVARRSKLNTDFGRGDAMVTPRQLKSSIRETCRRYEAISGTPDWPRRDDVYYKHGTIPVPDPEHARFWTFVDFFLPASPEDRALIAAFCCSPLWYIPGIDRPSWIIDSKDGPGCGKTTFVEIVADMYGHAPISTSRQELTNKIDVLIKRCVSQEGRKARVMLIDNIVGVFNSSELADLITRKAITGIPPYGRGEEVRPNNLIFAITANSATVSHDIADRSFYINLSMPEKDNDRASWKGRVMDYIERHRLEIVADIIDMLSRHTPFSMPPRLRFAAFEQSILQPCCQTEEMYDSVCSLLKESKEESNIEQDQAREIAEMINAEIARVRNTDVECPVFIHSKLVNSWGRKAISDTHDFKGQPIILVRQLAKAGFLPQCDKDIKRWPTSSRHDRVSGIAWNFRDEVEECVVLRRDADGNVISEFM